MASVSTQQNACTPIFCSAQWNMGERDQMAVSALAATGFGVGLGAVGGDHLGCGPVVAVGEQDPLSEDLCFQRTAGLAVQAETGRVPAGDGDLQTGCLCPHY
jgi:hypothetical protein